MDVENALKAKDVLCVSCAKSALILCHDTCLANYKLNVHSKVKRALFTTPRTVNSKFEDTTPIVSKTRFYVKTTQSKSLDTTPVVSKTKIAAVTPLSAKNKVSSAFTLRDNSLSKYMKNKIQTSRMWQKWHELQPNVVWSPIKTTLNVVVQIVMWIVDSGCSKHMMGDRSLLENFVGKFMGTVCFRNDHFTAITCYGDYVQCNITFDELTTMASKHDSLEPVSQRFINDDSSAESMNYPSKEDLDNLFRPMYDEYFEKKSSDMPINSAAQQVHNQEDSSSTSSTGIEVHEAPPIITTSEEQTSPVSLTVADELYQEDSAELDGNTL
ncbi:hypothetical protein Tco_0712535 [Tanacetum coccineum]